MNIQENSPEFGLNPCPACGSQTTAYEATRSSPAAPDFDRSALLLLESENSGLRRLIIELIEKNQQLRDKNQQLRDQNQQLRDQSQQLRDQSQQLRDRLEPANAPISSTATDLHLVDGRIAS